MFDADRAITSSSQDRLNRTIFAKYLARCMLDHTKPESIVIGLYGGWGAGKTSILNLVLEELNFAGSNLEDEEKPIVLNFSAWSYSGQNQLIYSFFRRLSSTLHQVSYLEDGDRIIYLLELYVSFFTHKPVPRTLRTHKSVMEKVSLKGRDDVYAWESGRDLTAVKAELNELLKQQKHKIIIMIDNISRLYDNEVKQIFQIVKSMGDYANTAYLLAFDKEQIIQALNNVDGSGGREFIDKIVQLPFEVPPIQQQDLEKILIDQLNQVMADVPTADWNRDYWADVYHSSLKFFFENGRDVIHYVNSLSFSYPRLHDVVNPVDFFALTALQVFAPAIYFGIRDNKGLFTNLLDKLYLPDDVQRKNERLRCEDILLQHNRLPKHLVLELIMRLFPKIRTLYQPESRFYYSDTLAEKLRRISSPESFDAYFRLSMQTGQLAPSEFNLILKTASDNAAFDQSITQLNQDGRIGKFLDLLDSEATDSVPTRHIPVIIQNLLDNGDLFPVGEKGLLSVDTPMRIHRIIHRLLLRFNSREERFIILQQAISSATKSLYALIHELREQGRQHMEALDSFMPIEYRDLSTEQLDSLKKLAASRIEIWAKNGSLVGYPWFLPILTAWYEWGDPGDYVEKLVQDDAGLIAFLTAIFDQAITQTMTNYETTPNSSTYLADIDVFIPHEQLIPHAVALFERDDFEQLKEREQLALMLFLNLSKAKTNKIIKKTTV